MRRRTFAIRACNMDAFNFMMQIKNETLSGSGAGAPESKGGAKFVMVDPEGKSWPGTMEHIESDEGYYILFKGAKKDEASFQSLLKCKE